MPINFEQGGAQFPRGGWLSQDFLGEPTGPEGLQFVPPTPTVQPTEARPDAALPEMSLDFGDAPQQSPIINVLNLDDGVFVLQGNFYTLPPTDLREVRKLVAAQAVRSLTGWADGTTVLEDRSEVAVLGGSDPGQPPVRPAPQADVSPPQEEARERRMPRMRKRKAASRRVPLPELPDYEEDLDDHADPPSPSVQKGISGDVG